MNAKHLQPGLHNKNLHTVPNMKGNYLQFLCSSAGCSDNLDKVAGNYEFAGYEGRGSEMGAGGTNCPRASSSNGPHNAQCFKVWWDS